MSKCTTSNNTRVAILISLVVILLGLALSAEGAILENRAERGGRRGRNRGAGRHQEKPKSLAAIVYPNPYPCKARAISVPLPHPPPGRLYIPNCAVAKRCSGCCNNDAIECIPSPGVKHGTVKWKTNEYIMKSNGKFELIGTKIFRIPKHTSCSCGCKIRAEHCNDLQVYDSSNCRCNCKNVMENFLCLPPKIWDSLECRCRCPSSSTECSTGTYMDVESCTCISGREIAERVETEKEFNYPDIYQV